MPSGSPKLKRLILQRKVETLHSDMYLKEYRTKPAATVPLRLCACVI